jgi:ABC-2 type transport system ATP-binding protein
MNTHILSDVELICDRVAIIVKGVIRRQGRIEEVLPETEAETAVVLSRLAPEVVTRIEEDLGAELRGLGERVEWILPAKKVQKLVAAALESGAEIVSITPHRSSLEDVFMSVVREGEES